MENPVIGSSQSASRRRKRNSPKFDSSRTMPKRSFSCCLSDLSMLLRCGRGNKAKLFRQQYFFGGSMDRKTCIWSCNGDWWLDKSSGITWVGVYGMDSICVVSRTGDLDIKRVRGNLKNLTIESFLHRFRKTVISEIEDLEDPPTCGDFRDRDLPNKLRRGQCIKKPFGIVSVGTDEADEESGHEASYDECDKNKEADCAFILEGCERMLALVREQVQKVTPYSPVQHDEKSTIKFLQEKMKTDSTFTINEAVQALEHDEKKAIKYLRERMESDVAFTMDETIQAAISAFQHLFGKKFKANEIGVTVVDPYYNVSEHGAKCANVDVNTKELEIHDIEKHLAVINEPGSGGSSSSGKSTITSIDEPGSGKSTITSVDEPGSGGSSGSGKSTITDENDEWERECHA